MKNLKISLASALLFTLSLGTVMAQEVSSVTITPSKKGETSTQVISTIESDLNGIKPIENGLGFIKRLPTRWKITQEQLDQYGSSENTQFIEVVAKSDNEIQTATYDAKGNLVKLREVIINSPLPPAATDVISKKHNDWKILGNIEVINSASRKTDYIKVKMANGKKRKALFFSITGVELDNHLKPIN